MCEGSPQPWTGIDFRNIGTWYPRESLHDLLLPPQRHYNKYVTLKKKKFSVKRGRWVGSEGRVEQVPWTYPSGLSEASCLNAPARAAMRAGLLPRHPESPLHGVPGSPALPRAAPRRQVSSELITAVITGSRLARLALVSARPGARRRGPCRSPGGGG